jgi:L-ascorbate metabolism protein UlaG (beta-lactamase superfamily)
MGFSRAMRLDLLDTPSGTWSIVHAGDVGDETSPGLAELCADADVLLLPAGGTYTIAPEEAERFALGCGARDIILMHFRETGIDLPMLTPPEAFELMKSDVQVVASGHLDLDKAPRDNGPRFLWLDAATKNT